MINTTAGLAKAVAGPNVLRIRRTGGAIDAGSAWIQFDYLRLEADTSPQIIGEFYDERHAAAAGRRRPDMDGARTDSDGFHQPGIGDVTGLTVGGTGSINVNPAANTTYTLTATFNTTVQNRTVTVNTSTWDGIIDVGLDNNVNTEFSHEVAADDNYFARVITVWAGRKSGGEWLLNDDTDTNTVAGRTGSPAVGFERAVAESDPETNPGSSQSGPCECQRAAPHRGCAECRLRQRQHADTQSGNQA